jgi:hypothetical protein
MSGQRDQWKDINNLKAFKMPYGAESHYKIIREPDFDRKILEIAGNFKRLKELDDAIDWALARKPHYFNEITNEFYYWVTEQLTNDQFPQLKILYRIVDSEKTVYLIDVELA